MIDVYVLNEDFVRDYRNFCNGLFALDLRPDNEGNYYLSIEARNQFPEIDFSELEIVTIASE